MSDKQSAKQRAQILKALRAEHAETVQKTQAYLKEQQGLRKQLKAALQKEAMTIPQIASSLDLPADLVLWHVTAMKKYDLLVEAGQDGEYYKYEIKKEKKA
jgi:hypothetical protein